MVDSHHRIVRLNLGLSRPLQEPQKSAPTITIRRLKQNEPLHLFLMRIAGIAGQEAGPPQTVV